MSPNRGASRGGGIGAGHIIPIVVAIMLVGAVALCLFTLRVPMGEGQIWYLVISDTGEANVGTEMGKIAPNFVDRDNSDFSLISHRGKVVLLDFMASWCKPCMDEMAHLKEIFHSYSAEQLVIISIDVDPTESDDTIRQIRATYGDDWIFAGGPEVATTYAVIYIPTIYIIDKHGTIAYKTEGTTPASVISAEIDKLL